MKKLFQEIGRLMKAEQDTDNETVEASHQARAVLLLAISQADQKESDKESRAAARALSHRLGLDEDECGELLDQARKILGDSVSLYDYTSRLKDSLGAAERTRLMEDLWSVAYADGQLDAEEEHLIRRLGDLIGVSHRQYIQTKLKVSD